jgi:hypothetical protein
MQKDALKLKRKLAELEKWVHVNATDPKSVEELEDEVLHKTVAALNPNLTKECSPEEDQTTKDGLIVSFRGWLFMIQNSKTCEILTYLMMDINPDLRRRLSSPNPSGDFPNLSPEI